MPDKKRPDIALFQDDFAAALCHLVGKDPDLVAEIEIHASVDSVPTVKTTEYIAKRDTYVERHFEITENFDA